MNNTLIISALIALALIAAYFLFFNSKSSGNTTVPKVGDVCNSVVFGEKKRGFIQLDAAGRPYCQTI